MCGRSGSDPAIAVSGDPASALLALGADDEDESERLRRVGRSGSPADELPEAGGLGDEKDGVEDESVEVELPLESRPLKCGRSFPASVTTWGMFLPCFGFARLGGAAMGFHAP